MTAERESYEKGYSDCEECGCLRRRSFLESVTVFDGSTPRVLHRCAERDFCAEVQADKVKRARAEVGT